MLISLSEYAKQYNKSASTLRRMAGCGKFQIAKKIGRNWVVDSNDSYPVKMQKKDNKITVLSLFSGCGGLDLGFEGAFDVIRAAVNETICADWKCTASASPAWLHLSKTRFSTIFVQRYTSGC